MVNSSIALNFDTKQNQNENFELNDDIFQQFQALGRLKTCQPNQIIVHEGQRPNEVIIPLNNPLIGVVQNESSARYNFETKTLVCLPEAISEQNLTYNIISPQLNELLVLPFVRIRSLIDHDPKLRWQILKYLSYQYVSNTSLSNEYLSSDPSVRLAQLLLNLSKSYGIDTNGQIFINYKISQDELGSRIGVSRQSINKYIKEFVSKKYILKKGHKLFILDLNALIELSELNK